MNNWTDAQLLRDYADRRSEAAFTEIVRRHVGFAYSAALRMVCDPHLAEDVTQSVFVALAKNAGKLCDRQVLSGWLHRTAQNIAAQTVRTIERRRAREEEAAAMDKLLSAESEVAWEHIAPHLDAALGELSEPDRDALFLRYFEHKSAREMAAMLGISDDAAQKRVNRAVERLRDLFTRRGITVGASGLVVLITANAVEAVPAGLVAAISSVAVAGTGLAVTATTTTAKVIAMTTMQKTVIGAAFAAAIGTGVYEARQAATYRTQVETLAQQLPSQAPLSEQIRQLQQERDEATNQLAALNEEVQRLNLNASELAGLRSETARLLASKEPPANAGGAILSPGEKATQDVAQLTQEAWQLLGSGHAAEALSRFESAVKLDPANAAAWNGLGWASINSGKAAEAEKAFQRTVELEPENPAALNGLGQLYLSQKKYAEAETYLLKAGPKAPAAWFGLAKLYLLQDKFDQAEQWAQTIIDAGQGDEGVRAMLKAAKEKKLSEALRLMIEPQSN